MTAGVCVPQCVGECVSCVSEVNECYCVRGETPAPYNRGRYHTDYSLQPQQT